MFMQDAVKYLKMSQLGNVKLFRFSEHFDLVSNEMPAIELTKIMILLIIKHPLLHLFLHSCYVTYIYTNWLSCNCTITVLNNYRTADSGSEVSRLTSKRVASP